MRRAINTKNAPQPAGTYSQAIAANGNLVFISGQTPRKIDGTVQSHLPFEAQAQQTMKNLASVASAAGCTLEEHCAKVTVYLKNLEDRHVFDQIFGQFVGPIPPARAIVQSNFTDFDLEIDAILVC